MAREIERKFLVNQALWSPQTPGTRFRQGYIAASVGRTVRVRVEGDQGRLTLKGPPQGVSRAEFEYPIPIADAEELLTTLCDGPLVEKTRYLVEHRGHTWEVDVFAGENEGLVVAELELESEDEAFERPAWLGAEVSHDPRYANSRLAQVPWKTWGTTP